MKKIPKYAGNVFMILSLVIVTGMTVKAQSEETGQTGGLDGLNSWHISNNNVDLDIRPRFNYLTFTYPLDGGITIRYAF